MFNFWFGAGKQNRDRELELDTVRDVVASPVDDESTFTDFRMAFFDAPAGIVIMELGEDTMGVVRNANPAFCQILGYQRDEVIGSHVSQYMHPDDVCHDAYAMASILDGKLDTYVAEKRYVRKSGEWMWVSLSISVTRDAEGRAQHGIMHVSDVTAERDAQMKLRDVTRDLERANERLQATNHELDVFTSTIAHDLKGPLTAVKGFSCLLAEKPEIKESSSNLRAVNEIERGADRMTALIDDLLVYAQASSSTLELEDVDLNDVVGDLLYEYSHHLLGARLVVHPLPRVRAHRMLIKQLFANLIINGVKYVASDVEPVLELDAFFEAGQWTITVTDNGIGIKGEDHTDIFELFERRAPRGYEGSGIGLATSKRIAQRLGGEIWVRANAQSGSTFFVSIDPAHEVTLDTVSASI